MKRRMAGRHLRHSDVDMVHYVFRCFLRVFRQKILIPLWIFAMICLYWYSRKESPSSSPMSLFNNDGETLCVTILSAPNAAERRKVARETWMTLDDGVRVYFVVGTQNLSTNLEQLREEQNEHGDLILLPIIDSYKNLTLKLIETVKYVVAQKNCQFILKADDDSFLRIDLIVSELERVKIETWLYWGYFTGRAPVFKNGRWAERDWFLCDKYLPYARGGGYIFSIGIAKFIAANSEILERYGSEDVSFGVWTAPLKLHRVHDVRFDTEYKSRGCLNSYLITHKQSVGQMQEKMSNFRTTGRICKNNEVESIKAYNYNWTLPPTQCCQKTSP